MIIGFNVGTKTPPTFAKPKFDPIKKNILYEKIKIDPIMIYFIPSEGTVKLFLVNINTGIIKILERKNLQKAKMEEEQY